jgi:hydrogenase maturation protein HypF
MPDARCQIEERRIASDDPIRTVAAALREGKIAAIKGLGGFHLAVDATNQEAVQTLRERKWRERKPFALMVPDLETARRLCLLSDEEERLLADYRKPIVLARKRAGHGLAEAVAPASQYFGIMLPYTPVHVLLMHALRIGDCRLPIANCQLPVQSEIGNRKSEIALVMTSANRTDEPIAIGNAEALERLGAVADFFLLHNRAIIRRSDDSVTRVFQGRPMVQRRARGYVPTAIPVRLPIADCRLPIAGNAERHRESECPAAAASEAQSEIGNWKSEIPVLALGGDLKNTICIIRRGRAYLSQHIGDLDHADALSFFEQTIGHFEGILETRPALIAHDLHPGYHSTAYALRLAAEGRKTVGSQQTAVGRNGIGPLDPVPTAGCLHLVGVQHHHAHAAACMAEHGLEGPVIGVSLDGTGYGTDGRIWGGEFLVATLADFERVAHLRYVPMPGGERAIKEPWRMALAYLGERVPELERLGVDFERLVAVEEILKRRVACPETSSMGRLFDGVSALLGVCSAVSYEGQAAIELEALAEPSDPLAYPFWLDTSGVPWTIDPCTIVRAVLEDLRAGSSRERVADRFHNTVVEVIRAVCHRIRGERGLATVVLSGGCFQNLLLLQRTTLRLGDDGFDVRTHRLVPTNDGGLALGQAVIALARASEMANVE